MKKTFPQYSILTLLTLISLPAYATDSDFLNYEYCPQPIQTKQINTQNIDPNDPETLAKITATLNKRGIESIEEIGIESALEMYLIFYEIDYVEDIPEEVKRPKNVKPPKKEKKKKFQVVTQTILPEKATVVDLAAKKKQEEEWQERTLKAIKDEAEKFVKEQESHLSLIANSYKMKSIISLSSMDHFQEKQERGIQNYSVEEFVLEEPSALPTKTDYLPSKDAQTVAPPPSKSNKKKQNTKKKAKPKAMALEKPSREALKYGEITILSRPQKATLSTADEIKESFTSLQQADSLNHYHHLYSVGVPPYGPLPGVCFSIPYYPYPFPQPIVLDNVIITNSRGGSDYRLGSYNVAERRYEKQEPGVFVPGIHFGAEMDYRVGFLNEATKLYENVEPGVFIPRSHPILGKIISSVNKSSESN